MTYQRLQNFLYPILFSAIFGIGVSWRRFNIYQMIETNTSAIQLIAPCGINCGLCLGFLRDKNKCHGCRSDLNKVKHCSVCAIKNCEHLSMTDSKFCYDCETYPCTRIKQLDKRYRIKYNVNVIDNHKFIKDFGIESFVQHEKIKWKCRDCGGVICVHRGYCLACAKNKKVKVKSWVQMYPAST